MPYIKQELRSQVEPFISELVSEVQSHRQVPAILIDIVEYVFQPIGGWRYHYLHRAYGVFAAAREEWVRRIAFKSMNYIIPDYDGPRQCFTKYTDEIGHIIHEQDQKDWDGFCNYVCTVIALRCSIKACGLKSIAGDILYTAGDTFYTQVVGPYENGAIEKNGDVKEYE